MVKLSKKEKELLKNSLNKYNSKNFENTLKEIKPILKRTSSIDPAKVGKRLLNKLIQGWNAKIEEGIVHYWAICILIDEYGYNEKQIDLEVACGEIGRRATNKNATTFCDIVIYSHDSRRHGTALVAIECRQLDGEDGSGQASSYARALNAKFHLFTDSKLWNAFETQPHPINGTPISDIPRWVGFKPLSKRLLKSVTLPPINDEKQLRDLVGICHNAIHSEGIDPAKAFDELVKLFFIKVFDEQELPDVYEFSVLSGESVDQTGAHIRSLLKKAKEESRYNELFTEPGDDEFSISNKIIRIVVETFQGFSFTGNSLIGIDSKGTVYENMVGSTFRGELGQYFTPRKIVEFMVDLLEPERNDIIWDPSCGSGGFLIYVLRKVASIIRIQQSNLQTHILEQRIKDFANSCLFGSDLSPRMVRASRMNMIMHGDGWSGINRCNGLLIQDDTHFKNYAGRFSLILSNPPFAGHEKDSDILSLFDTGKNNSGKTRGVNKAIIFVEQIINMLTDGGRAGLVLPRSIFENESYSFKKIRSLIFNNCEILAVVGLPKTAFHHTDCGILGDLLFIKKTTKPRKDYKVFVGWAENVGYNTLGHNIDENDFFDILANYRKPNTKNQFSITQLIKEDNINPWNYHPKTRKLKKSIKKHGSSLIGLNELVSPYNIRISRAKLRENPDIKIKYSEVRDFDPETGEFKYRICKYNTLPSRATYELNGDDLVLLPNARNSLESRRKVIKINSNLKGIVLTNRFLPLRPKVNIDFIVWALNSDFVRDQLISVCRGAGSPDFRESKLSEIKVPVPNNNDLSTIDAFMEKIEDNLIEINDLEQKLDEIKEDTNLKFRELLKTT